ncbi:DUF2326 domain-containing protein [Brevibacillus sp. HB1.2]|uniref:DUF2326 domain-containing protein n=1 Tax=Brevibacillus sp. HB1.2 TaxID=2738807 RepID=UPI00157506C4|nr:DUF2326 domain-containing protein [Brevibacillus sp. HB1.2]NTU20329.1 DUF2326 domain-containing protein [Brevibacillus sp. HB1.2]
MILKKLYIYSLKQEKILKQYDFNEYGVNIILGEKRSKEDETNGVGKTTMVDCIEMLLGKTMNKIYEQNETLIVENVMLILQIEASKNTAYFARLFNMPKKGFSLTNSILSFDLADWKTHTLTEYKQIIHDLVFKDEYCDFSFSALREYIIRDEKKGFNDITLIGRNATNNYAYLAYLFGLPHNSESEINNIKKEIDEYKQQIKLIENIGVQINNLKIKEEELKSEINSIKASINTFDMSGQYNKQTIKYSDIKTKLNNIQKQIFEAEHICKQYKKNIENLTIKTKDIKELKDVKPFYQQLLGYFPDNISKNYKEVEEFYEFMVENRGKYFNDKIEKLQLQIIDLTHEKATLENELKYASELIVNNDFVEDITSTMRELESKQLELAEVKVRISEYNRKNSINEKINMLEAEKLRVTAIRNDEFASFEEQRDYLNIVFNQLTAETYNQAGVLNFEYENSARSNMPTGRIKINCSIPDENSHGRLYMKINMFDLTWFLYRVEQRRAINFLIHDGSYSKPDVVVKPKLLEYVNFLLSDFKFGQYFVTINIDELLDEDIKKLTDSNLIVAKLDRSKDENRFLGIRF